MCGIYTFWDANPSQLNSNRTTEGRKQSIPTKHDSLNINTSVTYIFSKQLFPYCYVIYFTQGDYHKEAGLRKNIFCYILFICNLRVLNSSDLYHSNYSTYETWFLINTFRLLQKSKNKPQVKMQRQVFPPKIYTHFV